MTFAPNYKNNLQKT